MKFTAKFTRCTTQEGEPDAAGCMTPEAIPRGMETWAWRIPSKIQMHPKLIRRR